MEMSNPCAVLGMMEELGIAAPPGLQQKYLEQEQVKAQQALELQRKQQMQKQQMQMQMQKQQPMPIDYNAGLKLVKAKPQAAARFIEGLQRRGYFQGVKHGSDGYQRRYAKAVVAFAKQQQQRQGT